MLVLRERQPGMFRIYAEGTFVDRSSRLPKFLTSAWLCSKDCFLYALHACPSDRWLSNKFSSLTELEQCVLSVVYKLKESGDKILWTPLLKHLFYSSAALNEGKIVSTSLHDDVPDTMENMLCTIPSMSPRTCLIESRSRRVTVESFTLSKSTVIPNGVPSSSNRAYLAIFFRANMY